MQCRMGHLHVPWTHLTVGVDGTARTQSLAVLDQREQGSTESDAGLAGLGRGLETMTKLRSFTLDNRQSRGLGSHACPSPPQPLLSGLGALGQSLRHLHSTLRMLDLNFDGHNGGLMLCDRDVAEFAKLGLGWLTKLEVLSLGLNSHQVGDQAVTALGIALAGVAATAAPQTMAVRGVNLRLQGNNISGTGLSRLSEALASVRSMQSLALMLGDGAQDLGAGGIEGLAAGLGQMSGLQALWLRFEDDDQHRPPDATSLKAALSNLTQLQVMHSDIRCLYCTTEAPYACGPNRGTLAPALRPGAKCIECNVYPTPDQCHCWEQYANGCTQCDRGNWAINKSSCTD
eukprot:COSAG01_NODE_5935_length_3944_cov_24.526658_3_plen_344_part_00